MNDCIHLEFLSKVYNTFLKWQASFSNADNGETHIEIIMSFKNRIVGLKF